MRVCRVPGYRLRQQSKDGTVIKTLIYRGCKVQLLLYKGCSFKFSYSVIVPNVYLRLTKSEGRLNRVLHDPTSHRIRSYAIYNGKVRVNELLSPFWFNK